ncbi:MAG: heme transporter ATP-binding protein [Rhodospirillales bacterium]|nr:heme transporter ATP-binding protein [Rhodospirillales bacterium]
MTDSMAPQTPALELVDVQKSFGAVRAVRGVSFAITRGTIHGIVGENGAGKSTLMNLVYGFHRADAGEIRVDGTARNITSPDDAIAAGIGMVHQHYMLVEPMTVLENIVLGTASSGPLARTERDAKAKLEQLMRETGLSLPLDARVADLEVGARQQVEILKALFRDAQILILDEPTSVLTPRDTERLFDALRRLRDHGRTILVITHKLEEITRLTDRVTVMRQGLVVGDVATRDVNEARLAEMMVGRPVLLRVEKGPANPGETVLELTDLSGRNFAGVSFKVRRGEIVGVAGVAGNGQSELLHAVAGLLPSSGGLAWKGEQVTRRDAAHLRALGVAHVPEDRQRDGLVQEFPAQDTAILGRHGDPALRRNGLLSRRAVRAHCEDRMRRFDVRPPDPAWPTRGFSGGNQQKLVLAREMECNPDLLLIGQPTRGVDVGAIEFIYARLIDLRDRGGAVLLVSSELDQLVSLADRILVMSGGKLIGEVAPQDATDERLGLMMGGVTAQAAAA